MTLSRRTFAFSTFFGAILTVAMPLQAGGIVYQLPAANVTVTSAENLAKVFATRNFTLAEVRRSDTVPRIYVSRLPGDLTRLPTVEREALFIRLLLPLVAKANSDLFAQRERLIKMQERIARGLTLDGDDRVSLVRLAQHYRLKDQDVETLLYRVDIIPASLAIAQAINESGWGTAHLAKQTNGLFGEHARTSKRQKVSVGGIPVAAFPNLLHGVYAYMHNLNTGSAYKMLRRLRAEARAAGRQPNGTVMALGLKVYSERGREYVNYIRRLIEQHGLSAFDPVALAPRGGATLIAVRR